YSMHHGDIAHVALEGRELLENVLSVLSCESGIRVAPQRVRPMAGGTCRYTLRWYAVLEDFAPVRNHRGIVTRSVTGLLLGIVLRERLDGIGGQPGGHSPHIGDRVGISAGLLLEELQLADEVFRMLTGEARKLRIGAVAVRTVAGPAHPDRHVRRDPRHSGWLLRSGRR